jgi:hypothetical protein
MRYCFLMPTGQQFLKPKCSTEQHGTKLQAYLLLPLFASTESAVDVQPLIEGHPVLLLK